MDRLVRRVIKIQKAGDKTEPMVVYERPDAEGESSGVLGPAETASRRMLRAEQAFANEALRLHDKSVRDRDGGWLVDAPVNFAKAQRKAYNVARKAAPLGLVPKLPKI